MKLAFYKASHGTWLDKTIAWWTRPLIWKFWESGKYSHVEFLFSDNSTFAASPEVGGTRFSSAIKEEIYDQNQWELVDIDCFNESTILAKCNLVNHAKYDWFCIFFSFVIPFDIQDPSRYTCSELVDSILFNDKRSFSVSPNALYDKIVSYLASNK